MMYIWTLYYRDPSNEQIYDDVIGIDFSEVITLLQNKGVDQSIIDHLERIEIADRAYP
jgi:hypothetical protein